MRGGPISPGIGIFSAASLTKRDLSFSTNLQLYTTITALPLDPSPVLSAFHSISLHHWVSEPWWIAECWAGLLLNVSSYKKLTPTEECEISAKLYWKIVLITCDVNWKMTVWKEINFEIQGEKAWLRGVLCSLGSQWISEKNECRCFPAHKLL